jgi:hypothetical protein
MAAALNSQNLHKNNIQGNGEQSEKQTLMNQHQLDTLSFVCLLRVNAVNRNMHAVNTHTTHAITPNRRCAEPPEDGRVTPETCRGIDS